MATGEAGDAAQGSTIDHSHLRSALEFAVLIAAEAQKRKPPMAYPRALKRYFNAPRIPTSALARIRRSVEEDAQFRQRLAEGALPELVDEIGRLWLRRPDGWEQQIAALVAVEEEHERTADAEHKLRRAERRREAAELATTRATAESIRLTAAVEELEARITDLERARDEAERSAAEQRRQAIEARNEARHARDREAATAARLAEIAEGTVARAPQADAEDPETEPPERVLLDTLRASVSSAVRELEGIARNLTSAAGDASEIEHGRGDGRADQRSAPGRRPLRLPGGVRAGTPEAAEHLLRSGAAILVDGYNVSMTAWPGRALPDQRSSLLDAVENLAARFDADPTIVFDGSEVLGAHASGRRRTRVVYSPAGVTADDVIRTELGRCRESTPVVVVTSDAEIVRDVKAMGANAIASEVFVSLL